jgi:putative hydrolase of the HAD superfamily
MPIRAVIFDYGEVLCTPDLAAHRRLLELTGLDHETFERFYWRDRHDYDLGNVDGPAFWQKFARDAGLTFTPETIAALIENDVLLWVSVDERMLAWAAALQQAGILTAILSNMVPEILRYMRQEFAWLANFTQQTYSCEFHIAKPDPAIFTWTCGQLAVRPDEALFVDDRLINVEAAEKVGLHAIHFRGIDQLRADLAARNLTELPEPGHDPCQGTALAVP